jgi:dTDP-4-dehydrorhamnose 3,5-epimerase
MVIHPTDLEGVLLLEPAVHFDARGFFLETYNQRSFAEAGITKGFVQDNHSHSRKGVLRGLHYQSENGQGKLIRVLQGEIFDVAVDIRPESRNFGKWAGVFLNAAEMKSIWIPEGFAHGFYTLSNTADVSYKVTDIYNPEKERTLSWNDPDLAIRWPLAGDPILSEKDKLGHSFRELEQEGLGKVSGD